MGIKGFAALKLREGDTFTEANGPELAGKTVWDIDVSGRQVYLTMTDRTSVALPGNVVVEVLR
jgi:hypothetical protein